MRDISGLFDIDPKSFLLNPTSIFIMLWVFSLQFWIILIYLDTRIRIDKLPKCDIFGLMKSLQRYNSKLERMELDFPGKHELNFKYRDYDFSRNEFHNQIYLIAFGGTLYKGTVVDDIGYWRKFPEHILEEFDIESGDLLRIKSTNRFHVLLVCGRG